MRRYSVRLLARAVHDLVEIGAFIAQDSPQDAERWIERVRDELEGLDVLPGRFAVYAPETDLGPQIRSFPVGNYRVIYRIEEETERVLVLHIRHTARRSLSPDEMR